MNLLKRLKYRKLEKQLKQTINYKLDTILDEIVKLREDLDKSDER